MRVAFVLVAALLLGACQTTKVAGISAECAAEIADVERYNKLLVERGLKPSIVLMRPCRIELLNAGLIQENRPTSVTPIAPPKGPQLAKGAVIFLHGGDSEDLSHDVDLETPDLLYRIEFGGLDVFRLDLAHKDRNSRGIFDLWLPQTITDIRRRGYKKIFVVGQSLGGFAALGSIQKNEQGADGAIAFAPAWNGVQPVSWQTDVHRKILSGIAPSARVAIFHFQRDELLGNWHTQAVELSRQYLGGRRNAMVRVPPTIFGHAGIANLAFVRTYADCLAQFLASDDPDGSICPP